MRVLITGAAGTIGRRLSAALAEDHELRLADLHAPEDDPRWMRLDVADPRQCAAAVAGMDAVIHLAIASGFEGPHEDDAFNQQRFDVNVRGTFNLLSAAARAGVRRFVHTSSIMVVWGYPPPQRVAGDAEPRPVGTYALTKQMAEAAARYVSQSTGLSTICLRIPKPVDLDDPSWKARRLRPQWLPFPDLIAAYRQALTAPGIQFEIVTVVADNPGRRWDLQKAERVLNWRPQIDLRALGYTIGDENEPLTVDG